MATSLRYPKGQAFFDNNGAVLASGSLTYYQATTTTLQDVYSDAAGLVALPNPVSLNASGRAVDGSNNAVAIYLKDGGTDYKEVIKNSAGTTLYTDDNIPEPIDLTANLSDFAKPQTEASTDTSATVNLDVADFGKLRIANTASNSITYNLPSAATVGNGKPIGIKKISGSNTVTLDASGSDTIDGAGTFAWTEDDRAIWIVSDGANWQIKQAYLAQINSGDVDAASDTAAGVIELAIQSEMETGTDVVRAVVPGRQHFHPGHPKAWGRVAGGGTPSLSTSYNITSITDTGDGILGITIATDFSGNYACIPSATGSTTAGQADRIVTVRTGTEAAGTIEIQSVDAGGAFTDPAGWIFAMFGDQA